jgi:hypothetical protein
MNKEFKRKDSMPEKTIFSASRITGALLVLSFVLCFFGASLYGSRVGAPHLIQFNPAFVLERGLFISAVILTALGFVVLETIFQNSPAKTTAHIGTMTYFFGAVLLVVAECLYIQHGVSEDSLIFAYVVLALLGQATIGITLLQSNLLPNWIGWTTIVWNLGMLIILVGFNVGGHYIPLVHHVMPLLIGIPLLWKG